MYSELVVLLVAIDVGALATSAILLLQMDTRVVSDQIASYPTRL